MLKVVKELIMMLLVCLAGILLFAVVFYEYIPSRKVVAEVTNYKASERIESLLADDIDQKDNDVIMTFQEGSYEVTSSDLNNYKSTNEYVPGKTNPFAAVSDGTSGDVNSDSNSDSSDGSSSDGNSTTTNTDDSDSYFKDTGTK